MLTIEMKDVSLRYEPYVQDDVWSSFNELVIALQSQRGRWFDFAERAAENGATLSADITEAGRMCDRILFLAAQVRVRQVSHLKQVSGEL